MKKLALGIAIILLIALVTPVLAGQKGVPDENSAKAPSIAFYAHDNYYCPHIDDTGYSEVGHAVQICPYWHGLSTFVEYAHS